MKTRNLLLMMLLLGSTILSAQKELNDGIVIVNPPITDPPVNIDLILI